MKNFYKSEKGSVSIFLIIIFTVIFFLNAVLIDYARIIAAKHQAERAVKAAVRSVLSAYDTGLYSNYGVFGFNENTELFNDILYKNLSGSSGYFYLNDLKIEDSSILEVGHELGYHEVFKRQILEEMKYKAPIDFTLEVIDKLSSLAIMMKETSHTTEILIDINEQYEIRNRNVLEAVNSQKEAVNLVGNYSNFVNDITINYNNYNSSIAGLALLSDEDDESNEREELEKSIEQYKNNAINQVNQIYDRFNSKLTGYIGYLEKAEETINNAYYANKELKRQIEEAASNNDKNYYDRVHSEAITDDNLEVLDNIQTVSNNISRNIDLVIPDEFFVNYRLDVKEQKELFQNLVSNLDIFRYQVINAFNNNGNGSFNQAANNMEGILSNYYRLYGDLLNPNNKIIKKEVEFTNIAEESGSEKKSLESQGDLTLNEVFNLLETIKSINNANDEFTNLDMKFTQYDNYNFQAGNYEIVDKVNNSSGAIKAAGNITDEIFLELTNILENIRDELYIGEYVFSRFNYFDSANFIDVINYDLNNDSYRNLKVDTEKLKNLLDVSNQEIEYIIYGFSNVGGNVASVFADIFLIRLAINMIEAFTNPIVLAATNPLVILFEALVYSIKVSTEDIIALMQGKEIPLTKKIPYICFGYNDYLRILYQVRGSKSEKLSRIQAVIDYESGKDLTKIPTYIKGDVDISVKLWFLPSVMKTLNYTGVLDGRIDKNRYVFTKQAAFFY